MRRRAESRRDALCPQHGGGRCRGSRNDAGGARGFSNLAIPRPRAEVALKDGGAGQDGAVR